MNRFFRLAGLALALLVLAPAARADSGWPIVSDGTANCQVIAKGQTWFTGFSLGNNIATSGYLKLYDMNTTPVAGALQGAQLLASTKSQNPYPFEIPGNTSGAGSNALPMALLFQTGLALCIVGGTANSDTTVPGVGQIIGTIFYTGQYPR